LNSVVFLVLAHAFNRAFFSWGF